MSNQNKTKRQIHPMPTLERLHAPALCYEKSPGIGPLIVFCHGFMSDMAGAKALALEAWAQAQTPRHAFVRFDSSGHGRSAGDFQDGTISAWAQDLADIIDHCAPKGAPCVLIGSSMGGWLALLAARARPSQVKGLLLIAPAPDFTHWGFWQSFDAQTKAQLHQNGVVLRPSAYSQEPYPITRALIEDATRHFLLENAPEGSIDYAGPVEIVHGLADPDVPWALSLELAKKLKSNAVNIHFVKDGDHRLSRPCDLNLLKHTLNRMISSL
jgi:pimeloyl-ACP methyl ester carboxylesterase